MKVRELRAIFAKLEGTAFNLDIDDLDLVIVMSNGGEWNVGRATPAVDSDGEPIFAIVPRVVPRED